MINAASHLAYIVVFVNVLFSICRNMNNYLLVSGFSNDDFICGTRHTINSGFRACCISVLEATVPHVKGQLYIAKYFAALPSVSGYGTVWSATSLPISRSGHGAKNVFTSPNTVRHRACKYRTLSALDEGMLWQSRPLPLRPRAGSRVVRMDPLRFLAGCRTRPLNQV